MLDSLTEAQKFALTALLEVTPVSTVGDFVSETDEGDYVTSYRFATTLTGYPGWNWTVTVADLPDEHPTVVESELLPADGALLAPDWIPWSERMDDYRAAQLALGEAASEGLVDDDDDVDDDDADDDDDDEDVFGSDNLHGGDLDGVDIDEIDDEGSEVDEFDTELSPEAELVADVIEADSEALNLQVDQADEAKAESDSGRENPPRVAGRRKRASKEQQNEQGD
jgi:hypothetical protein